MKTVSRLSIAPVKGMALVHPEEISLGPFGVAANRRFHVVDEDGRRYGQIRNGTLTRYVSAGNPGHVTVPKQYADHVAPRFRSQLVTY